MEVARFTAAVSGPRLDLYLVQERKDLSRSFIQKLIADGSVTVNDVPAKSSLRLKRGDVIVMVIPPPPELSLRPEAMPLSVVYEDDDVLVIDKPANLPVHPGPGHASGTLANALLAYCPQLDEMDDSLRPGIVHRLDKDTSGLMMVAKNEAARRKLSLAIKERQVVKRYLALVVGCPQPEAGTIDAPIARHPVRRQKMAVVPGGRPARTHYRVLRRFPQGRGRGYSLLEVTLETGRTHQIRVHMAHIGHPLVGDSVYGRQVDFVGRQFLHAHRLGFRLPSSGEYREFRSELPDDLRRALAELTRTVALVEGR